MPLREVFEADAWRDAVDAAGVDALYLVRCGDDELKNLGVRMLSYRWATLLEVDCGVLVPGTGSYRDRKHRTLATDALGVLCRECAEGSAYVWVDFLSHLDVPAHRTAVLNSMGCLYTEHVVLPHYLMLFAEQAEAALLLPLAQDRMQEEAKKSTGHAGNFRCGFCGKKFLNEMYMDRHMDNKHGEGAELRRAAETVQAAMRRGWIQQEIGYGELDYSVVMRFVQAAMVALALALSPNQDLNQDLN